MSTDPDIFKIPAFKRKRSIQGRAKKKLLLTALDRQEAGIPIVRKKTVSRKPRFKRVSLVEETPAFSAPIVSAPIVSASAVSELAPELRKMKLIGICEGYFGKIDVAIVTLSKMLKVGERVLFETKDGLFEQEVDSMQINRKDVAQAKAGSDIGMKVKSEPIKNGKVYKVV
jgi:hypothetical protein